MEGDDEEPAPVVKQKQEYYWMVALARRQIDSVRALIRCWRRCWRAGVTTAHLTNLESQLEVTFVGAGDAPGEDEGGAGCRRCHGTGKVHRAGCAGHAAHRGRTVAAEGIEGDLTQLHLKRPAARHGSVGLAGTGGVRGAQAEPYAAPATAAYPPEAVAAALTAITVLEQLELGTGWPRRRRWRRRRTATGPRDLRRMVRPLRAQMRAVLPPSRDSVTIVPHTKAQRQLRR